MRAPLPGALCLDTAYLTIAASRVPQGREMLSATPGAVFANIISVFDEAAKVGVGAGAGAGEGGAVSLQSGAGMYGRPGCVKGTRLGVGASMGAGVWLVRYGCRRRRGHGCGEGVGLGAAAPYGLIHSHRDSTERPPWTPLFCRPHNIHRPAWQRCQPRRHSLFVRREPDGRGCGPAGQR